MLPRPRAREVVGGIYTPVCPSLFLIIPLLRLFASTVLDVVVIHENEKAFIHRYRIQTYQQIRVNQ